MKNKKMSDLGASAFCESMTMMVGSGIQADEAISLLLEDQSTGGVLMEALSRVKAALENGAGMAEALAGAEAFPDYLTRMVALGERSGQLEEVFRHLADYYARQHTISRRLQGVVRYPAVMLAVIAAVLAVMLAKVLPVFSDVYESMTGSLAASSYRYIHLAYGLCWAALIAMLLLALLAAAGLLLWRLPRGRAFEKRILERFPVTSGLMERLGLYRFFVSLEILLAAGEPQDLAVEESLGMVDCGPVEEKVRQCLERMTEGEGLAQAAYHVGLLEPVYGRMLLAGSRSGNLDRVLERVSGLLQESALQRVDLLVNVLDPVLSGIMMLTVGFSLISVMLPLIGMMNSIG